MAPKTKVKEPKAKPVPKQKPKAVPKKVLTATQASECKKNFFSPRESAAKAKAQESAKLAKEHLAEDACVQTPLLATIVKSSYS